MTTPPPCAPRPPRWAERLLLAVLPEGLSRDALLGDLEEDFNERAAHHSPDVARRRYARQAVGIVLRFTLFHATRPQASRPGDPSMLRSALPDIGQGFRSLLHAPSFTLLAVLTLAAGVGSTTAIFSVVDGVLLRPLPYPDADRILAMRYERDGREMVNHSEPEFLDYEAEVASFSDVAAWSNANPTLGSVAEPERIPAIQATASLLPLLGVEPLLGRTYSPEEDVPDGERVVVLSHGLWVRSFAADRGVLGRTIILEDQPYTVIGVMPEGFSFPEPDVQAWMPLRIDRADPWARNNHYLAVVARLAPDIGLPAARSELDALATRSSASYPDFYSTPASFHAYP
ncbi:MAG TPA: ABC transporter permease, partial [Longimicrobiales bacterium]|nr:ABC transporter permease [Longimicrobiales bacterium]